MTDFERLLQTLASGSVEYILIGGLAANAHGAIRTTRDVDVVYARSLADSMQMDLFGVNCRCLTLEALIRVKRAAGRPKDFEAVAELEALWQERQSLDQ